LAEPEDPELFWEYKSNWAALEFSVKLKVQIIPKLSEDEGPILQSEKYLLALYSRDTPRRVKAR
jgi:hypothetical protein